MFDWTEYLVQAKELADGGDEAGQRSAVSRAYYSVFCGARNHLRDNEGVAFPPRGSVHGRVWKTFQDAGDKDRRQIGQTGNRLRVARAKSDYDDEVIGLAGLVTQALQDADAVAALLLTL